MENGKIDKIWDNSENGNPNFSIDLADGKRLYAREHVNASNRNIFVTGVVGRAMGSGNFQIQDIDSLTSMAIATYNKYFI
jgi:hypothetical protein